MFLLQKLLLHCFILVTAPLNLSKQVQGWTRVAPLSCILLSQVIHGKLKHKEDDNPTSSANQTLPNTDNSASTAEHRCEVNSGTSNSSKKTTSLNEQMGSWSNPAVAALQLDASERAVLSAVHETTSPSFLEDTIREDKMIREASWQPHHLSSKHWPAKPQKHSHRSCNTVVPIKNFTFLPPINPSHLNSRVAVQLSSGEKSSEGETLDENGLMFNNSETRGTRVDSVANKDFHTYSASLTSKLQPCQHNYELFSAVPKRYQLPMTSKFDTVHRTRYSPVLHSTNPVGAQALMHRSYLFS